MPKFDKFNKLIIPERKKKSESDIKFYEDYLVKDPEKRKNLTKEEDDIVKE